MVTFSCLSTPLSIQKRQISCFQLHINACSWDNVVKWSECHAFHQTVRSLLSCPIWQSSTVFDTKSGVWSTNLSLSTPWRGGKLHSFFTSTRPLYPGGKNTLYPVGLRAGLYVVGNGLSGYYLTGLKLQHIRKFTASNGPFVRCGLCRTYQGWRTA